MDIIVAVSTPLIPSAIGILRLSGEGSAKMASQFFIPVKGVSLEESPSHLMRYGKAVNSNGEILDECMAVVFRSPASYTGEESVEFQCHGSPVLLSVLLKEFLSAGARQAEPGEFTKRAFLNGKLDLIQTEAVIDLIDAETPELAKNAAAQLEGVLSRSLSQIYEKLTEAEAHFQAIVDYPDEDLDPFQLDRFQTLLTESAQSLRNMADSFERGQYLKNGISCILLGKPNVGKSSLFNHLMGYDRVIVTEIPGTTRDTVSERIILGGIPVNLTDTAGVRESEEVVEQIGVDRTMKALDSADLILMLIDASVPLDQETVALLQQIRQKPHLILLNKSDLPSKISPDTLSEFGKVINISAKEGLGIESIENEIKTRFSRSDGMKDQVLLTNARHASAVKQASDALFKGAESLRNGMTPDAVLIDLEDALHNLAEILGRSAPADLLQTLFSRFCVGK